MNRSGAVGNKKILVADQRIPSSTSFLSPRLFIRSSSVKNMQEQEAAMSPTSILEAKNNFSMKPAPSNGIADALIEEKSGRVLRGSQLKIQVSFSPIPIEFGIKTKESLLSAFSPSGGDFVRDRCSSPRIVPGSLPKCGMELSEDYTCVITRGANPRMIHIFEDYIVESSAADHRDEEVFCCKECSNEWIAES
ncbi:FCS-Like Zinc finger 8-like [Wolffia australiana]